ncbi:exported hypothetical protein [Leptospira interrogans serovar Manilae]|uniref:Uncharacterized protein n=1 Tax=Leptospira interrogans serovar Manilae TaxID=214675 RepID=A0AAQ1SQA5_LEPIR|nr:exported hypothetical protein [Leptospira interrogans serovar Manilae]
MKHSFTIKFMVFNFIRIDKTISLPDRLFLTFLICIAMFTDAYKQYYS